MADIRLHQIKSGANKIILLKFQGIGVFLRPRDGISTTCPYRVIKTVDQAIKSIVGEEMMERLLICPKCLCNGRERYFGTSEGTLGVDFEILNDMDQCASLIPEEGTVPKRHSIKDTHHSMMRKVTKKIFSIDAFLKDGIEQVEKTSFKELRPSLKVGDQVWIFRNKKANCASRIMPYAHVTVYVGEDKVVHVTKNWNYCAGGLMMGTIKKVPIGRVIKDDDQGEHNFSQ